MVLSNTSKPVVVRGGHIRSNNEAHGLLRLGRIRFAGWFGASQGAFDTQFRSHFSDISPLDGKPAERDAPRGFDRSRERSSGGQSDRRPAPKEQPPPETLRQKDRIG
jgi:hypothetical protein